LVLKGQRTHFSFSAAGTQGLYRGDRKEERWSRRRCQAQCLVDSEPGSGLDAPDEDLKFAQVILALVYGLALLADTE